MDVTKEIRLSVHLPNLLKQAADEMRAPGVTMGFYMALGSLDRIAKRAIEINDEVILEELKHLTIITSSESS